MSLPVSSGRGDACAAARRLQNAIRSDESGHIQPDMAMDIMTVTGVVISTAVMSHRVLRQGVEEAPQGTSDAPSVGALRALKAAACDVVLARQSGRSAELGDALDVLSAVVQSL